MASKVVKATDENIQVVTDFIHEHIPDTCPKAVLGQLDLAIEEIYINIAHYAYGSSVGDAEITCIVSDDKSEITIA
ncbi:MAG: ATP-binding protein, partial [Treponema sp.]|nr:ATP-binding protein [Treponema sp.]